MSGSAQGVDHLFFPSPPPSASSSISYDDTEGLLTDLQSLLCDIPEASDAVLAISPSEHVPIHTQLLSARSAHLSTSLHPPWRQQILFLPEASPDAIRDVVEYLYTAAVRLETASGTAIPVSALAHYLSLDTLSALTNTHIASALTPTTFLAHLRAALTLPAVPPPIEALLADCAAAYPARILTSTDLTEAPDDVALPLVRATVLLLASRLRHLATTAADLRNAPDLSSVLEGLIAWSARHSSHSLGGAFRTATPPPGDSGADSCAVPAARPLVRLLDSCEECDRAAIVAVLTAPGARVFRRRVVPLGVLSTGEVLGKYRDAAVAPRVFESAHPHRASLAATRVEVDDEAVGARVRFDYRTSMREETGLVLFGEDGVVVFSLRGAVEGDGDAVVRGVEVPLRVFWFEVRKDAKERGDGENEEKIGDSVGMGSRWGFRLVIEPIFSLPPGLVDERVREEISLAN